MRELAEMSYEFDEPFVLDTTKYRSTFGTAGTPLPAAIGATVAWYQSRNATPHTRPRKLRARDPNRFRHP
jgi:hypothetical protein